MEGDMLVVLLRHAEHVRAIGHEDVATFLISSHILRLAFLEGVEFGIIVALYPAGFVHLQRLPLTFGLILMSHLRPSVG